MTLDVPRHNLLIVCRTILCGLLNDVLETDDVTFLSKDCLTSINLNPSEQEFQFFCVLKQTINLVTAAH